MRVLATEDEVTAAHVYRAMDQLMDCGLNPVAGSLPGEDDEEVPD
jgi:hypothetical protein